MKESVFSSPYLVKVHLMDIGFLLLQWPDRIDNDISNDILGTAECILERIENLIDVVPAYSSLGVYYDYNKTNHKDLIKQIAGISRKPDSNSANKVLELPVCYDSDFSLDIEDLSISLKISKSQIIALHIAPIYRVSFIGFLPGFMYLSGLNAGLKSPRRTTPRITVPVGAVAIGGEQTGVYPIASPGGWHIIGRCPLRLFNKNSVEVSRFSAGNLLRMKPISKAEFESIYNKEYSND